MEIDISVVRTLVQCKRFAVNAAVYKDIQEILVKIVIVKE